MGPSQDLDDLLRRCTVRLRVPQDESQGTGFWIAPGLLLTCAHVVETAHARSVTVEIARDREIYPGRLVEFLPKPFPDLALLCCDGLRDHPCVYLNSDIALGDSLYSYGYTDQYPRGDSATFAYEGPTDVGPGSLLKLKQGQSRPGLSGAPLLNLRTGGVCGIVKSSRDLDSDLGGRAVPLACIPSGYDLRNLQQSFHQRHGDWLDCLNAEQRRWIPWQAASLSDLGTNCYLATASFCERRAFTPASTCCFRQTNGGG
ncbi:MAG: trypsin-like peptidase domain-containing protein [Candidatus Competibacteraceae bacterium]|nr:trypsin-like peptidase domain-containing protein [Candidatus Competibacteraceae bacterium]